MNKKMLIASVIILTGLIYNVYAENDHLLEQIKNILPSNWKLSPHEKDIVQPTHWPKGKGEHIFLQRKGYSPEDWKYGLGGEISIWVMRKAYNTTKPFDYAIKGTSQVGPAKEIGIWKNQRIFLFGSGGKDWPTWEKDIIKTFDKELRNNDKNL